MPFLDEKELASLQQEIHDANVKRDELENELGSKVDEIESNQNKARNINVLFAIIAGASLAFATYLINSTPSFRDSSSISSLEMAAFKKKETARLLDSISNLEFQQEDPGEDGSTDEGSDNGGGTTSSLDEDMDSFSKSTRNETIYSVQIGIFSKKKYPLLSQTIAGTTSQARLFKYSVGLFKTLDEARKFRRHLVNIGFSDAFVASYINGERQQIHSPN